MIIHVRSANMRYKMQKRTKMTSEVETEKVITEQCDN